MIGYACRECGHSTLVEDSKAGSMIACERCSLFGWVEELGATTPRHRGGERQDAPIAHDPASLIPDSREQADSTRETKHDNEPVSPLVILAHCWDLPLAIILQVAARSWPGNSFWVAATHLACVMVALRMIGYLHQRPDQSARAGFFRLAMLGYLFFVGYLLSVPVERHGMFTPKEPANKKK